MTGELLTLSEAIDQRIPGCVIREMKQNNFEFVVGEDRTFSTSGIHLHSDFWDKKEWRIVTKEELKKEADEYVEPTIKAFKIELLIIDHDNVGEEEIKHHLEHTKYPNHCIGPDVKNIECRDIGVWDDDHPLNSSDTFQEEYERLFK